MHLGFTSFRMFVTRVKLWIVLHYMLVSSYPVICDLKPDIFGIVKSRKGRIKKKSHGVQCTQYFSDSTLNFIAATQP